MFSLRDLRFVRCSRDLDVLRAQRIIGFFILITHKSTRSENPSRGTLSVLFPCGVVELCTTVMLQKGRVML